MGKLAVFRLFYNLSIFFTILLAILTLAGAWARFVSPAKSGLISLIGLSLPALLIFNVLFLVYWIVRGRIWCIIPLVAILGNWQYFSSIIKFSTEGKPATKRTFVLATYNVNSFNDDQSGYTCKEIAAFLENKHVDVFCVQEFNHNQEFTEDSIIHTLHNFPYYSLPKAADGRDLLQVAIFSKFPICFSQLIDYPNSKNCSLLCDLIIKGDTIRIFNNHLQTTEVRFSRPNLEKGLKSGDPMAFGNALRDFIDGLTENFRRRASQVDHINGLINASPYPTISCGDFNSLPSSYTYQKMLGTRLKDGFRSCGHGYMYTYRFYKRLLRIDYIFHSKEFEGVYYSSPELECSDHNPVLIQLNLPK